MVAQIDRRFLSARPTKLWPRMLAYALFEGRPLTTRGRWINPFVFAGYQLWGALPAGRPPRDPVFILGLGRTGTTVLGIILAAHKDVGYLNEPKALWHAALGNDDLIGSYSRQAGRYRITAAQAGARAIRHLRRYHAAYRRLSGSRQVVEKYPELLFRMDLLNSAFPKARKILLIRNGNDTCQSIRNWSKKNAISADDWWGRERRKWHVLLNELVAPDRFFEPALPAIRGLHRDIDMAAVEWIVTMREAMRLQAENPGEFLVVRYEDLTRTPRAVLSDMLEYCDLPPDPGMLDYGSEILRPGVPHPPARLHPALQPLFDETMSSLGYERIISE